jgi:hypothetical protein
VPFLGQIIQELRFKCEQFQDLFVAEIAPERCEDGDDALLADAVLVDPPGRQQQAFVAARGVRVRITSKSTGARNPTADCSSCLLHLPRTDRVFDDVRACHTGCLMMNSLIAPR